MGPGGTNVNKHAIILRGKRQESAGEAAKLTKLTALSA